MRADHDHDHRSADYHDHGTSSHHEHYDDNRSANDDDCAAGAGLLYDLRGVRRILDVLLHAHERTLSLPLAGFLHCHRRHLHLLTIDDHDDSAANHHDSGADDNDDPSLCAKRHPVLLHRSCGNGRCRSMPGRHPDLRIRRQRLGSVCRRGRAV
jgi:hypothetical protein